MCFLTLTSADIPEESLNETTNTSNTTSTSLPSEPRPLPELLADPIPDRIPIPIFNKTNVLPLRGRSAIQTTTKTTNESFCHNDHYWITYPGSNRICSRDIEPLTDPITS